jgi:polyphosphate:AMP phosphotransferase
MFETAELGQKVAKKEYQEREPVLRQGLLSAQQALRKADYSLIVLFGGVDKAGKGETANLLSAWLDPRGIVTRAFGGPSDEEAERPEYWRYWRDLPPRGQIGIFLSAWYSKPLLLWVYGKLTDSEFDHQLDTIHAFERTLTDDGTLFQKFWMHLGKKAQKKRLKQLENDPKQSWRVTDKDWEHWKMYNRFIMGAERLIRRTSTGQAPWTIVEGEDGNFRHLKVGSLLLHALEDRLAQPVLEVEKKAETRAPDDLPPDTDQAGGNDESGSFHATVLDHLDMTASISKKRYHAQLVDLQGRLNRLERTARERRVSTILVFEGWDAAGKGGAIRRLTAALDARDYQVIPIAAPSTEELAHHYLWRFWRHLPRGGRCRIFDRSWYGRVLVERVERLASPAEWRRAYAEINDFEERLVDHGIVLLKFWLHITKEEQLARFEARQETPYKSWKLTDEDWRNREKWDAYKQAVNDMIERTSSGLAPWVLVEANSKRFARLKVLESVCDALERRLE